MSPKLSRLLLASLTACTGLLTCPLAYAQVGPSSSNVKKPAPKKAPARKPAPRKPQAAEVPVVRVRTVPPKPKVARVRPHHPKAPVAAVKPPVKPPVAAIKPPVKPPATTVRVQPPIRVPAPDSTAIARRAAEAEASAARERLRVAAAWQQSELEAFEALTQLAAQAKAPALDRIRVPQVPKPPAAGSGRTTYRQKVTLLFVREDGVPFTGALAGRTPSALKLSESGNRMEFEGARLSGPEALLQLALPPDWGFTKPEDARVSLEDYPGQESVAEEAAPAPAPRPPARSEPLFASEAEEAAARKSVPTVEHKRLPAGPYARPAAAAVNALEALALARESLGRITPASGREARLKQWAELERVRLLLDDAALSLSEARGSARGFNPAPVQGVLKTDFRVDYRALADTFALAEIRLAEYRAEAEWLRAQVVDPDAPNRTRAIQALAEAPEAVSRNPEVTAQLLKYKQAAEAEGRYRTALQNGALNPPPARSTTVTHHLTRTLVVRKNTVEVRFAEADLRRGDLVTLGGTPVSFDLQSGFWVARVPRAIIGSGARLQVRRGSGEAEMRGELPLPQLNAYASAGNLLRAPEMKPVRPAVAVQPPPVIPTPPIEPAASARVAVTAGPLGEIPLFRELTPDQARALRREGEESDEKGGASWLTLRSVPLSLRLQRVGAPAPADEDGEKNRKKKAEPSGRVRVVGVRMEGPAAGEVSGIRVGSSSRAVQNAFGVPVDRSGTLSLKDGAIQLVLREGIVQQILITREVDLGR